MEVKGGGNMAYLHVNGIDLYVEVYGKGTPLVCLHGNGEDHTTFDTLGHALRETFTVYAFDSRGHGRSTMVQEYHYADMAQDIAMALEELFDEPVDLLGFSDGGIVALFLAIWFPQLVRRMIVCGANYHPYGIREEGRMDMQRAYEETGSPLLALMLQEPWLTKEDLHRIHCPVWVIAGADDIIAEAHTRELAASLLDSRLWIVEAADHSSYVVNSDQLADACVEFFHGDRLAKGADNGCA